MHFFTPYVKKTDNRFQQTVEINEYADKTHLSIKNHWQVLLEEHSTRLNLDIFAGDQNIISSMLLNTTCHSLSSLYKKTFDVVV